MLFTGKDYDNLRVKSSEAAFLLVSAGFTKETKARRLQTLKKKIKQTTRKRLELRDRSTLCTCSPQFNFKAQRKREREREREREERERRRSFAKGHF